MPLSPRHSTVAFACALAACASPASQTPDAPRVAPVAAPITVAPIAVAPDAGAASALVVTASASDASGVYPQRFVALSRSARSDIERAFREKNTRSWEETYTDDYGFLMYVSTRDPNLGGDPRKPATITDADLNACRAIVAGNAAAFGVEDPGPFLRGEAFAGPLWTAHRAAQTVNGYVIGGIACTHENVHSSTGETVNAMRLTGHFWPGVRATPSPRIDSAAAAARVIGQLYADQPPPPHPCDRVAGGADSCAHNVATPSVPRAVVASDLRTLAHLVLVQKRGDAMELRSVFEVRWSDTQTTKSGSPALPLFVDAVDASVMKPEEVCAAPNAGCVFPWPFPNP